MWLAAEQSEMFDTGWISDHLYACRVSHSGGPSVVDPDGASFEAWGPMFALASVTHRIRLGVLATNVALRHPAILGKMAAELDVISGGRAEVGLGAGWCHAELDAIGLPLGDLKTRSDRLAEYCYILDGLLRGNSVNYSGTHFRLTDARLRPLPAQRPRPPIVICGSGERRTLKLAAEVADHWNYTSIVEDGAESIVEFARKRNVLHNYCSEIGRDPARIEASIQVHFGEVEPRLLTDCIHRARDVGADRFIVGLEAPYDVAKMEAVASVLEHSGDLF
jgi:alkanesulfonate monooxygenase SsuD/methylene tetrahydromethanopterin reductase-like flavin-dependent oxidoreductase (luciferase family)